MEARGQPEESRGGTKRSGTRRRRGEGREREAVWIDDAWYQRLGRATPLQTSSS